jgi:hypothetical protein
VTSQRRKKVYGLIRKGSLHKEKVQSLIGKMHCRNHCMKLKIHYLKEKNQYLKGRIQCTKEKIQPLKEKFCA